MTELQAMPMFWSAFFADTEHMTEEAAKAHLFLLGHAWLRGARLPDDDGVLSRLCRIGPRKWASVKSSVLELWNKDEKGFWTQKRMSKEFDFVRRRVEANRENGLLGGRPKSPKKAIENNKIMKPNGFHEETQNNPPTPTPTPTPTEQEEKKEVSCPKRVRTRLEYPSDFIEFWKSYPVDQNMGKKEAFAEWRKLDPEDRAAATASCPSFRIYCETHKDYRPIHAGRYLANRRFEGHLGASVAASSSVFVRIRTTAWEAWDGWHRRMKGQAPPVNREGTGWYFPSEFPPGIGGAA